jgi:uncharacterized membrane protein
MEHIMYGLQFLNIFTSAGGSIAMRKMKSLHFSVLSWYSDWSILISAGAMIAIDKNGLSVFYTFNSRSWFLLFLNGFTAAASNLFIFQAFRL